MRLFITKGLAGFAATGDYMKKVYSQPNECPRCGLDEDFLHVLTCTNHDASAIWKKHIDKALSLIKRNIGPQASFITEQYLLSWRNDTILSTQIYVPSELQSLFEEQSKMGWDAFSVGRVSKLWSKATTSVDSHNNKKRWVHSLITNCAKQSGTCGIIETTLFTILPAESYPPRISNLMHK